MAETKEQRQARTEREVQRQEREIIDTAMRMVPAKHLTIWSECRKKCPDIHTAEVWRVLVNSGKFTFDHRASVFAMNH